MCLSEFFMIMIAALLAIMLIGGIIGFIIGESFNIAFLLLKIVSWPFRALGRLVSPQKKNKTQHFHFEDDDIDIRF